MYMLGTYRVDRIGFLPIPVVDYEPPAEQLADLDEDVLQERQAILRCAAAAA